MRRLNRPTLPQGDASYLARRQTRVDAGQQIDGAWRTARRTRTMGRIYSTLSSMSGVRARCFFCGDSRGTDIDHFWPKAIYPGRGFSWLNFILACSGCNRDKGARFPLDATGLPLLIDPTVEDPWDFLFFDATTGQITPRWGAATGSPDPKGVSTATSGILPLNIEAIADGRLRTVRRLSRAVRAFLDQIAAGAVRGAALRELLTSVADSDDYGLGSWFFLRDGRDADPFSTLRAADVAAWNAIEANLS